MSDVRDDDSRLGNLVSEIQAKIEEIKAVLQPSWEQLAEDVRAKADEISDAIDAKVAELAEAIQNRPRPDNTLPTPETQPPEPTQLPS